MEKKKYCTFCGAENKAEDLLCYRCQENLNAEDELLKDFLIERTKDKLKGNLDDSLRDIIMNFLKSHLYGMVFTISLVAAISINVIAGTGVPRVTQRPDFSSGPVIQDQTNDEHQNEVVNQEMHMTDAQLEVKEIVDLYFETARNEARASEAEALIHYEEFDDPDIKYHFIPSFDVSEVDNLESIKLDYHLLRVDPEWISYSSSTNQRNAGYSVSEVTLVETLVANGTTTETMFDICLVHRDYNWRILQVTDVSDDPKSLRYYDDLLWEMMYETLSGLKIYFLPEEFGYSSEKDIKDTMELGIEFEIEWFENLGQTVSTEVSDQLTADGYRIAQVNLIHRDLGKEYVMTFANAAGQWYVAEVVEK